MAESPNFDHLSDKQINWLVMIQEKIQLFKELEVMKLDSKLTFIYMTIKIM